MKTISPPSYLSLLPFPPPQYPLELTKNAARHHMKTVTYHIPGMPLRRPPSSPSLIVWRHKEQRHPELHENQKNSLSAHMHTPSQLSHSLPDTSCTPSTIILVAPPNRLNSQHHYLRRYPKHPLPPARLVGEHPTCSASAS